MQLQDDSVEDEQNLSASEASIRNPGERNYQLEQDERSGSPTKECTVYHIVKHVGNCRQRKYVVRCYGYMAHNDTMEPLENIAQNIISAYCTKKRKNINQ